MTYLDRALHGLDWLFSNRSPDLAQLFVGLILWAVACALAALVIVRVQDRRNRRVPR